MSQSFNTTRVGACVDAIHINEVGELVPILHIAEFILYCRLVDVQFFFFDEVTSEGIPDK